MKSFARSARKNKTTLEDSLDDGGLAALYAEGSNDSLERRDDHPIDDVVSENPRSDITGRFGVESAAMSDRTEGGHQSAGRRSSTDDWKMRYMELKTEYEALLQDYEALVAERSTLPPNVKEELANKDNRIRFLEEQLNSKQQAPLASPLLSPHSSQQIEALNEEIQKLLEQRIELEAELADLRYGNRRTSSSQSSPVTNNFDQERLINNLRAQIREKDEEIDELQAELTAAREEIGRLGGVVGIVANQVQRAEKKKKKSWFGSKKKRPEDISAAKLGEIAQTATAIAGGTPSDIASAIGDEGGGRSGIITITPPSNTGATTLLSPPQQSTASAAKDMATVVVSKRMLELERENARLEGEIDILEKEKKSLTEKFDRLEAQHEALTKVMANDEHNRKAIEVTRGVVALPIPKDGGSELDRLKALVNIQEAAIKKLSIQNQQLEDNLRVYGKKMPQSAALEATLQALRKDYSQSQQEVTRLRRELSTAIADARSANNRASYSSTEAEQLRRSLKSVEEATRAATAKLKRQIDEQSRLIMSLMERNEFLIKQAEKGGIDMSDFRDKVALQLRATEKNRAANYPNEIPTALRPSINVIDPPLPLRARCDGRVHNSNNDAPAAAPQPPKAIYANTPVVVEHNNKQSPPQPSPPPPPPPPPPKAVPYEEPSSSPSLSRKKSLSSSLDYEDETINFEYPRESSHQVYEYRWTDDGYALRETSGTLKGELRPSVVVEHKGPGPFPPEEPYYGLTDDNGGKVPLVPEVTETDRARCTVALRQWIAESPPPPGTDRPRALSSSPLQPTTPQFISRPIAPPPRERPPTAIQQAITPPIHQAITAPNHYDSDEDIAWAKGDEHNMAASSRVKPSTERRQHSAPPSASDTIEQLTDRHSSTVHRSSSSNKSPPTVSQNDSPNEFDTFAPGATKVVVSTSDSGASKGFGAIRRSSKADSFSNSSPLKEAELAADSLTPRGIQGDLGDTNWLDKAPSDMSDDKFPADDSPRGGLLSERNAYDRISRNDSYESKGLLIRNGSKNSGDFRLFRDQEGTLIDDLR